MAGVSEAALALEVSISALINVLLALTWPLLLGIDYLKSLF